MSKSKIFLLISFLLVIINIFYLLFFDEYNPNPNFIYEEYYNFDAQIKYLDKKIDGWNMTVRPVDLVDYEGGIIIYLPLYPEYAEGQKINIYCKINKPSLIEDEEGEFAYHKFLAKENIFGICFRPKIKILGLSKSFGGGFFNFKRYLWNSLNNNLVEPASSLSKAIILGNRKEIPDEVRGVFAKVGLSHVIAISGLHIAIIIYLLQKVLLVIGIGRQYTIFALGLILFFYLHIIGFPSSAVRASAMIFIMLLGPLLNRKTLSIFSLIFVLDIFILSNKYLILYDIGFQLSFLAVLGILLYSNYFKDLFKKFPKVIQETFAVTFSAQVFTWPIVVYNFKIFSIVAPVVNLIVLPLLPFVIVGSFIVAFLGNVFKLFKIFSWVLFVLIKIIFDLSEAISRLPLIYMQINNYTINHVIISFIFMIIITIILKPYKYED